MIKRIIVFSLLFSAALIVLFACTKPRVELDNSQWGDKAQITGLNIFRYNETRNLLNYQDTVTGYQFVTIKSLITFNNTAFKVDIVVDSATNLTQTGIRISHFAQKIEPQNGAPQAGYIKDFSKGPYIYRLFSADGTTRDWTLSFSISPKKL